MLALLEKSKLGSTGDKPSNPSDKDVQFDFEAYFLGHTRASGWFSDRFGKPKRHFCGDFFGFRNDGQFVLDEKLFYSDGIVEYRQWSINVTDNGIFSAQSESLINGAHGFIDGNRLSMSYSMKVKIEENKVWDLDMKDLMILQPDGSLHNITHVSKWGLRIGTVSTQYLQHDGEKLCVDDSSFGSRTKSTEPSVRHLSSVTS
ncbi:MAG: DUF3833 family protein [Granulosicoccus sp.]